MYSTPRAKIDLTNKTELLVPDVRVKENLKILPRQVWWQTSVIPALRRLSYKYSKFEDKLAT